MIVAIFPELVLGTMFPYPENIYYLNNNIANLK